MVSRTAVVAKQRNDEKGVGICAICTGKLDPKNGDTAANVASGVCNSCEKHPASRRRGVSGKPGHGARAFTDAEKSLIRRVHGYMPAAQLLAILNERLKVDLGPDAIPYTMEQLDQEIGDVASAPNGGHDWTSLRKLLAGARRDGTLKRITEQHVNDFAVVFRLNEKQLMTIKDIVLQDGED